MSLQSATQHDFTYHGARRPLQRHRHGLHRQGPRRLQNAWPITAAQDGTAQLQMAEW